MSWLEEFLKNSLLQIRKNKLFRELREVSTSQGARIVINGKEVVNFSSNDYLGLASHPEVIQALIDSAKEWGVGSGAARLIVGNHSPHIQLEKFLAEFKEKEAALVFNTGYHANTGIISAIMNREGAIFSDELNHASIIDGCRLSKTEVKIFRHRDMEHLEKLLRESRAEKKLIVTDSVFSMDGDLAPLPELVELAAKYDAAVMVDEAHATGVFGPEGRGLAFHHNLQNKIEIHMGTLGKAVGIAGGYVAGSKALIDFLINKSRSFIFTTGYPPALADAIIQALKIIKTDDKRREKLWENVKFFQKKAEELFQTEIKIESPIIPIVIGDPEDTMRISRYLFVKGFFTGAVRPPTVPPGTSRLRISLMATHTEEEVELFLNTLKKAESEMRLNFRIGN